MKYKGYNVIQIKGPFGILAPNMRGARRLLPSGIMSEHLSCSYGVGKYLVVEKTGYGAMHRFFEDGLLHREDGPAVICRTNFLGMNRNRIHSTFYWYRGETSDIIGQLNEADAASFFKEKKMQHSAVMTAIKGIPNES